MIRFGTKNTNVVNFSTPLYSDDLIWEYFPDIKLDSLVISSATPGLDLGTMLQLSRRPPNWRLATPRFAD